MKSYLSLGLFFIMCVFLPFGASGQDRVQQCEIEKFCFHDGECVPASEYGPESEEVPRISFFEIKVRGRNETQKYIMADDSIYEIISLPRNSSDTLEKFYWPKEEILIIWSSRRRFTLLDTNSSAFINSSRTEALTVNNGSRPWYLAFGFC